MTQRIMVRSDRSTVDKAMLDVEAIELGGGGGGGVRSPGMSPADADTEINSAKQAAKVKFFMVLISRC